MGEGCCFSGCRMGGYKGLIAWQRAMDLAAEVHQCSRRFPREEIYGLVSQVRRAAVSVPSNIAEGHGRETPAEFKHVLRISRGSAQEVATQLLLAIRFTYISPAEAAPALNLADEVCRLIRGLSDSLRP